MKISCFHDFLRKNQFSPIFYTQNTNFSIIVDDVLIVTSNIMNATNFGINGKGTSIYSYTVVLN